MVQAERSMTVSQLASFFRFLNFANSLGSTAMHRSTIPMNYCMGRLKLVWTMLLVGIALSTKSGLVNEAVAGPLALYDVHLSYGEEEFTRTRPILVSNPFILHEATKQKIDIVKSDLITVIDVAKKGEKVSTEKLEEVLRNSNKTPSPATRGPG